MKRLLFGPITGERRVSVIILVYARWLLAAVSLVAIDYRPDAAPAAVLAINLIVLVAAALNLGLHLSLRSSRRVPLLMPLCCSLYDVVAITAAIALVDGFRSSSYILYYPALLAFSLVFPGTWSVLLALATAAAYVSVIPFAHDGFRPGSALDQKVLLLRLATIAATVMIANMVVAIERDRRRRAVADASERAVQVVALEKRTLELERAAQTERRRLSREVHDGISQDVYMLALGLETAAAALSRQAHDPGEARRLDALVRLAKQTLLETRNLLYDLEGVMAGHGSFVALVGNQAREFSAVTGIPVELEMVGDERPLPATAVGQLYRVVQEALANVFKHAEATSVTVRLRYTPESLTMVITDNGAGFDAAHGSRGHGLRNMRERSAMLGGCAEITARPGHGTSVRVEIPAGETFDDGNTPAAG